MRDDLIKNNFAQVPQLTASQPIDLNHKFDLVPDGATGTRRALLIGINYVGHEQGVLSGCHNGMCINIVFVFDAFICLNPRFLIFSLLLFRCPQHG
jgi:hypothetical protein